MRRIARQIQGRGLRFWRALALAGAFAWGHGAVGQLVRVPNTTLNLPAELPTGSFGFTNFVTNSFSAPICVAFPPGETNRMFVLEKGSATAANIRVIPSLAAPTNRLTFLTLGVTNLSESGLLGMAFHPGYATNRQFYVFYSLITTTPGRTNQLHQRISRFLVSTNNPNAADAASEQPIITQYDQAGNHNGGDLHFGPDGYLYVSLGDEGGGGDTYANSQTITNDFFAGILRIDVDKRVGNLSPNPHPAVHTNTYLVPAGNPFVGATSYNGSPINPGQVRTEFWATGLRNPWRMSFDPATGELWCGDVGQSTLEEIDLIQGGKNYGWAWREGTNAYTSSPWGATPPPGFTPTEPVWAYGRTLGRSVTGGVVYRGTRYPELDGAYIFADYEDSGNVWALRRGVGGTTVELLTQQPGIVDFAVDPRDGDILVANISAGRIRRLVRTSLVGTPPPALLSQTGAFSNLTTRVPNAGIVPYDINVPFWSDHAVKSRWFSIPGIADDLGFDRDETWSAPTGAVWIKHFDLETNRGNAATRIPIETRFIVKTTNSAYGITYRWTNQSDAVLVPEAGMDQAFDIIEGGTNRVQAWRYPGRNECRACHTPQTGFALSFNTRQMNRPWSAGGSASNQIAVLQQAGYFSGVVSNINGLPFFARADDSSQSLEARARSYLAVNCISCHQPGGVSQGLFDVRPTVATDLAGLINGALVNDFGDVSNRVVVPGDLQHSVLLRRIEGTAPRMPPLATRELDQGAIALLQDWIGTGLTNRQSFADWQVAYFGSTTAPGSGPGEDPDGDGWNNRFEYLTYSDPLFGSDRWPDPVVTASNGLATVSFYRAENRSFVIERSTNLLDWVFWDVAGNAPWFSSEDVISSVGGPVEGGVGHFFRLVIGDQ